MRRSYLFGTVFCVFGLLAGTVSPVASQSEPPEDQRPDPVEQPVRPAPLDRDLGSVVRERTLPPSHERLRDLPEPSIQAFESRFDLERLSDVAMISTETIRLEVPGLGVVVAVFEPLVDPIDLAPWPVKRYDKPVQQAPLRVIATEQAWIGPVPIRAVLSEPVDGSGPPTLQLTEADRVTVVGPCTKDSGRATDRQTCVVTREARQLEPGAVHPEYPESPRVKDEAEPVDPDPYTGIEIVDPEVEGGFASAIAQLGGTDPDIDILVVRVGFATDTGIQSELATVQAGSLAQGLNFRYQIVGTMFVNWPGAPGAQTDADIILDWAEDPVDGVWDNIAVTRNQVAADLVLVVVSTDLQGDSVDVYGSVGTGGIPPFVFSGTKDTNFVAVVRSTSSVGIDRDPNDLVVPHELGHLFGMSHDLCTVGDISPDHGFIMPSIGPIQLETLMSNPGGRRGPGCTNPTTPNSRVPRWSTLDGDTYAEPLPPIPFINFVALGAADVLAAVPGNQVADNEARWESSAWDIARYRVADVCPFGTNGAFQGGSGSAPAQLVSQQYWDILGRAPDSNGLAYWESLLVNGEITGSDTITNFVRGPEFEGTFGEVIRMYQMMQGRIADVGGLDYWSLVNTNRQALAGALMTAGSTDWSAMSDAQFVGNVWLRSHGYYLEHSWWIGQIANGNWSRPKMLAYFNGLGGARNYWLNTTDASMIYYGMLDRAPDAGGLAYWTSLLSSGTPYVDVITGFRGSPEYRNRVGVGVGC